MGLDKLLPFLGHYRHANGVNIVQNNVAARQYLTLEHIPNRAIAKLQTAGTNQNNSLIHSISPRSKQLF
jgi:hypothetical protein